MLIQDQFGIIQNHQMSPIPQTIFLVWDFFCRFLQQDSSTTTTAIFLVTASYSLSFCEIVREKRQIWEKQKERIASRPRTYCDKGKLLEWKKMLLLLPAATQIAWWPLFDTVHWEMNFDKVQGRNGWQGPQGLGLAWILKKRKWWRQHVADVVATVAALSAKYLPWRP